MWMWVAVIAYMGAFVLSAYTFFRIGWKQGFDDAQKAHVLARKFLATGAPRRPDGA